MVTARLLVGVTISRSPSEWAVAPSTTRRWRMRFLMRRHAHDTAMTITSTNRMPPADAPVMIHSICVSTINEPVRFAAASVVGASGVVCLVRGGAAVGRVPLPGMVPGLVVAVVVVSCVVVAAAGGDDDDDDDALRCVVSVATGVVVANEALVVESPPLSMPRLVLVA